MSVPATRAGHDLPITGDLKGRAFAPVLELQGRSPCRARRADASAICGVNI
jgi:hypothetical protein